jgi:hypothetical protein
MSRPRSSRAADQLRYRRINCCSLCRAVRRVTSTLVRLCAPVCWHRVTVQTLPPPPKKARQPIALGFAVPLPIGRDMYCSGRCLSTISLTVGEGLELHDGGDSQRTRQWAR